MKAYTHRPQEERKEEVRKKRKSKQCITMIFAEGCVSKIEAFSFLFMMWFLLRLRIRSAGVVLWFGALFLMRLELKW